MFLGLPVVLPPAASVLAVTLGNGTAQLQYSAGFFYFPDQLGGDIGAFVQKWANPLQVTLNWSQQSQNGFTGGVATANQLALGPLTAALNWHFVLNQVKLTYQPTGGHNVWIAQLQVTAIPNGVTPSLFGLVAGVPSATGTLSITDGLFSGASLSVSAGKPIPIPGTPMSLKQIGGSITTDPNGDDFSAAGTIGLIGGPVVKEFGEEFYAVGVNGTFTTGWGHDCDSSGNATVASPDAFYTLSGDISFFNSLKLVSGSFCWGDQTTSFGGQSLPELGTLRALMPAGFDIQGFIRSTQYFQATGHVVLTLPPTFGLGTTAGGDLTATNTGLQVCGHLSSVPPAFRTAMGGDLGVLVSYAWGAPLPSVLLGCQQWGLPVAAKASPASARTATAASIVHLPRQAGNVTFAVEGNGAPPAVTVTGPGGMRIRVAKALSRPVARSGWLAYADPATDVTYIVIVAPHAGAWSVRGGQVSASEQLPAVSVKGKIKKSKTGQLTLTYKASHLAGRQIELLDQTATSETVLTTASHATGKLTLTPQTGSGQHKILAEILANGLAQPPKQIATYTS